MILSIQKRRTHLSHKILSAFIAFTFIFSLVLPPGYAQLLPQTILNLPAPGSMVSATTGFTPPIIKGITIHPENPFEFDFIIGTGDQRLKGEAFKTESKKMIKYFLATLTVPEEELWVNLSPYEKDRIIPQGFGDTEMGRDLLTQDYLLKQLTASMMYPEQELGQEFWRRVYTKAREMYGTAEIPLNTFNKIWIVPQEALVYEQGSSAFVIKSHLKVMLEEDYEAAQHLEDGKSKIEDGRLMENRSSNLNLQSSIIKEVLIPEIEREVNEGQTFANLRQIYNSVILAAWYKENLKESLLGQIYVDKKKTIGVDTQDKTINEKIYNQYLEAFKKGVYNYIREDYDPATQRTIPRKYFSGGLNLKLKATAMDARPVLRSIRGKLLSAPDKQAFAAYTKVEEGAGNELVNVELAGVSKNDVEEVVDVTQKWETQQEAKLARAASPVTFEEAVQTRRTPLPAFNLKGEDINIAQWLEDVAADYEANPRNRQPVWVVPAHEDLFEASQIIDQLVSSGRVPDGHIVLGAQDVRLQPYGAYTGHPPSLEKLKQLKVKFVILGHSELSTKVRGEPSLVQPNELIGQKYDMVVDDGTLIPIVAIGETAQENRDGKTEEVLSEQLKSRLGSKSAQEIIKAGTIIANEPVWAIGEDRVRDATAEDADAAATFTRRWLFENKGEDVAAKTRIQFGGSVSGDNVAEINALPNVDGALVGGKSKSWKTAQPIHKEFERTAASPVSREEVLRNVKSVLAQYSPFVPLVEDIQETTTLAELNIEADKEGLGVRLAGRFMAPGSYGPANKYFTPEELNRMVTVKDVVDIVMEKKKNEASASSPMLAEGFASEAGLKFVHEKILKNEIARAFEERRAKDVRTDEFVSKALEEEDFIIALAKKISAIPAGKDGSILQRAVQDSVYTYTAQRTAKAKTEALNKLKDLLINQTRFIVLDFGEEGKDPYLFNIGNISSEEHRAIIAHMGTFAYEGSADAVGGPRTVYLTRARLDGYIALGPYGKKAFQELIGHELTDFVAGKHVVETLPNLAQANARINDTYKQGVVKVTEGTRRGAVTYDTDKVHLEKYTWISDLGTNEVFALKGSSKTHPEVPKGSRPINVMIVKADVGSIGGHGSVPSEMLEAVADFWAKAAAEGKILDFFVTRAGDDISITLTHIKGKDNPEIHKIAWDAFINATVVSKDLSLYGAGQDLLADSFSGNIKGAGPGIAEMEFVERKSEPIIVLQGDKWAPGGFNEAIEWIYANPNSAYNILKPQQANKVKFGIIDFEANNKLGRWAILDPGKMDGFQISQAIKQIAGDQTRYSFTNLTYANEGDIAAVTASRLHNIAGEYTGKDDPMAVFRTQGNYPAEGIITAPFFTGDYQVFGWMMGSQKGYLLPVSLPEAKIGVYDGPPLLTGFGFNLNNGRLVGFMDLMAANPAIRAVQAKVGEKTAQLLGSASYFLDTKGRAPAMEIAYQKGFMSIDTTIEWRDFEGTKQAASSPVNKEIKSRLEQILLSIDTPLLRDDLHKSSTGSEVVTIIDKAIVILSDRTKKDREEMDRLFDSEVARETYELTRPGMGTGMFVSEKTSRYLRLRDAEGEKKDLLFELDALKGKIIKTGLPISQSSSPVNFALGLLRERIRFHAERAKRAQEDMGTDDGGPFSGPRGYNPDEIQNAIDTIKKEILKGYQEDYMEALLEGIVAIKTTEGVPQWLINDIMKVISSVAKKYPQETQTQIGRWLRRRHITANKEIQEEKKGLREIVNTRGASFWSGFDNLKRNETTKITVRSSEKDSEKRVPVAGVGYTEKTRYSHSPYRLKQELTDEIYIVELKSRTGKNNLVFNLGSNTDGQSWIRVFQHNEFVGKKDEKPYAIDVTEAMKALTFRVFEDKKRIEIIVSKTWFDFLNNSKERKLIVDAGLETLNGYRFEFKLASSPAVEQEVATDERRLAGEAERESPSLRSGFPEGSRATSRDLSAKTEATSDELKKGGIDLNPMLMDMKIKRDGNGIPLPLPMQPAENLKIDGFVPVIINVTPIPSLPMFLGLADPKPDTEATYRKGLSPIPVGKKSTSKARHEDLYGS